MWLLSWNEKSTCHFQSENSKCFRVPYSIWGAKKQETFSDLPFFLPIRGIVTRWALSLTDVNRQNRLLDVKQEGVLDMSLKREMLVDAGIEDKETIERIMAAYGSAIKEAKSEVQAENDS